MHTPLTPTNLNGHGYRRHSPARPDNKHAHSDPPAHGLRAQLQNLLPRHSLFHAHVQIHQISSVPLVHGEFAARWKFRGVQSQTGLLQRVKAKRRGSQKGKGKEPKPPLQDLLHSHRSDFTRTDSALSTSSNSQYGSSAHLPQSLSITSITSNNVPATPTSTVEAYSNTRGMTPFYKLKDHAVVWDHHLDVVIKMDVDRETSELMPNEFKLVVMQRVIPGDPDAPRNPRVGALYLDLSEYAGVGKEVTRSYLLRDTKMNATVKLTIYLEHVGGDANYIAPPLPKGEIFNGVADLLDDDVYLTRPRALDLWDESDLEEPRYEVPFDVSRLPLAYGPKTTEMLIEAIFNPVRVTHHDSKGNPFTYYVSPEEIRKEEEERKLERMRDKDGTLRARHMGNESPSLYSADDTSSHSGHTGSQENSDIGRGRSGVRGWWSRKTKTAVSSTPTGSSRPGTPVPVR
ncbi:hypothetical protein F5890DRAFT_1406489 [Lentinula detonsa]|uniref:C2 NT-type domain-containing protein n=1 Tax=Lentinula detonsa TaxID=2804962 RepID=A0AA38Q4D8_9AGAR|nr:hypothetical protein F5890DRAFT_1406489 [Lentinula detonsa]